MVKQITSFSFFHVQLNEGTINHKFRQILPDLFLDRRYFVAICYYQRYKLKTIFKFSRYFCTKSFCFLVNHGLTIIATLMIKALFRFIKHLINPTSRTINLYSLFFKLGVLIFLLSLRDIECRRFRWSNYNPEHKHIG